MGMTRAVALAVLILALAALLGAHAYRGSDNAGVVVGGIGLEIWGHPGFFVEQR